MKATERITHAAEKKAFETVLNGLIKKGRKEDASTLANSLVDIAEKVMGKE